MIALNFSTLLSTEDNIYYIKATNCEILSFFFEDSPLSLPIIALVNGLLYITIKKLNLGDVEYKMYRTNKYKFSHILVKWIVTPHAYLVRAILLLNFFINNIKTKELHLPALKFKQTEFNSNALSLIARGIEKLKSLFPKSVNIWCSKNMKSK